jgi:hypothetical protein
MYVSSLVQNYLQPADFTYTLCHVHSCVFSLEVRRNILESFRC